MKIKEKWAEETSKRLKEAGLDKIPAIIKRCPKCASLSLEFDQKTHRIYCKNCGFESYLPH